LPVGDHVAAFRQRLAAQDGSGAEGPITFGEIACPQRNRTMVIVEVP